MRNTLSICAAIAALPTAALAQTAAAPAPVVINEINYDDSSADTLEFVELYNNTGAAIDLTGWTLISDDSNATPSLFPLPAGTTIPANGFLVIGDANVTNVDVINPSGFLQNGPSEIVYIEDDMGNAIDSIAYELDLGLPAPGNLVEGNGFLGAFRLTESLGYASAARLFDGQDSNDNNVDFTLMPISPGTSNQASLPVVLPYSENFDGLPTQADWASSFVPPTPSVPLTPSNNGGSAAQLIDTSGGGNTHHLNAPAVQDVEFRMEVLMTVGTITPGTDPNGVPNTTSGQSWSFGVRGHADSFGQPTDIPVITNAANSYATQVPVTIGRGGFSGIAWSFYETLNYSKLFLVDYNNAGTPIVLEEIDIVAGVNDSWQDLSIAVQGPSIIASFAGTTYVHDTDYVVQGSCWMAYREAAFDNTGNNWLVDDINIRQLPATLTLFNDGNPNSVGDIPLIGVNNIIEQFPAALNTVTLRGSNMIPGNPAVFVLGVIPNPLPGGFPLFGSANPFRLQMFPQFEFGPAFRPVSADGVATFDILVPPASAFNLAGRTAFIQVAEFDSALGRAVPVAGSRGGQASL